MQKPNIFFGIIVFWIVRCCKKNKYQNRRSNGVWLRVYTEIGNTAHCRSAPLPVSRAPFIKLYRQCSMVNTTAFHPRVIGVISVSVRR